MTVAFEFVQNLLTANGKKQMAASFVYSFFIRALVANLSDGPAPLDAIINVEHSMSNFQVPHFDIRCSIFDIEH